MKIMKTSLLAMMFLGIPASSNADLRKPFEIPYLFLPGEKGSDHEFVWAIEPGKHYRIDSSIDLKEWKEGGVFEATDIVTKAGSPSDASKPTYHRLVEVDLTPPEIISAFPPPGGYSIPRNSELRVEFDDDSGIDPKSIRITFGGNIGLTIDSDFVDLQDNILRVSGGSACPRPQRPFLCPDYEEEIGINIEVADLDGNSTTFEWKYESEIETVLHRDLFVFGSLEAMKLGQALTEDEVQLNSLLGKPSLPAGDDRWRLARVDIDSIRIIVSSRQVGDDLLGKMTLGAPMMNTITTRMDQVFFRRLTSKSEPTRIEGTGEWQVDLSTEDIYYEECFESFALSLDRRALNLEVKDNRIILPKPDQARSVGINFNRSYTLASISHDWSDLSFFENNPNIDLSFEQLGFNASVYGTATVKYILNDPDKRIDLSLVAEANAACIPVLTVEIDGTPVDLEKIIISPVTLNTFLIPVGPVVIPLTLQFETKLRSQVSGQFHGEARGGFTYDKILSYNFGWSRDRSYYGDKHITGNGLQEIPLSASASGSLNASVDLIPKLTLKVGGSLNVKVLKVEASASVEAALIAHADLTVTGSASPKGVTIETCLEAGLGYDIDASYAVAFDAWPGNRFDFSQNGTVDLLDGEFFNPVTWCLTYSKDWTIEDLNFEWKEVVFPAGDGFVIPIPGVVPGPVIRGEGRNAIRYQWFKDGYPIPGQNCATLQMSDASQAHAGDYGVRITGKQGTVFGGPFPVRVTDPSVPEGK